MNQNIKTKVEALISNAEIDFEARFSVSGINGVNQNIKTKVEALISNVENDFEARLQFLVIPKIMNFSPSKNLDITGIKIPQLIKLADCKFIKPGKIHLLAGAEIFYKLLKSGKISTHDKRVIL